MCTHTCGVRKRYSLPSAEDDIDRINNAIRQREMMGNITACGFISRIYSATVTTDSFMEKIY